MKKYEFTDEVKINEKGVTLKRIRATETFGSVRKGSLGGWIEGRHNLSSEGDCWVYDEAEVFGTAKISGYSKICGKARVNKVEDVLSFHPVGPEKHTLTAFKTEESFLIYTLEKIELETLKQFLKRIEKFQDNVLFKEYKAIAEVIRIRFSK